MTGQAATGEHAGVVPAPGERLAAAKLDGSHLGPLIDHDAMAVVSNLYRAAGAARNHFERTVLSEAALTWTSWVVLWVLWIGDEAESRTVAAGAGISKATLTGVVRTVQGRGLVARRAHPGDARRVLLSLTEAGSSLMTSLVPRFNAHESLLCAPLEPASRRDLAEGLRLLTQRAVEIT
ncbi:MAG: MarR family winged helix-turn-helix transcriptional regulator [Kineosporiaceae bacterium]